MAAKSSAAVIEAIVAGWDAAGLDAQFLALRTAGPNQNDQVLHEDQAKPGTPFPYCVYEQEEGFGIPRRRMTFAADNLREIRNARFRFSSASLHAARPERQ